MNHRVIINYPPCGDQGYAQGTQIDMPEMDERECERYLGFVVKDAMESGKPVLFRVWKDGRFDAAVLVENGGMMPRASVAMPDCIFWPGG